MCLDLHQTFFSLHFTNQRETFFFVCSKFLLQHLTFSRARPNHHIFFNGPNEHRGRCGNETFHEQEYSKPLQPSDRYLRLN